MVKDRPGLAKANRRVVERAEMLRDVVALERAVRLLIRWGYDGSAQHLRAVIWELKRRADELGEVKHG